jgi:hypothetical protein
MTSKRNELRSQFKTWMRKSATLNEKNHQEIDSRKHRGQAQWNKYIFPATKEAEVRG